MRCQKEKTQCLKTILQSRYIVDCVPCMPKEPKAAKLAAHARGHLGTGSAWIAEVAMGTDLTAHRELEIVEIGGWVSFAKGVEAEVVALHVLARFSFTRTEKTGDVVKRESIEWISQCGRLEREAHEYCF